MKRFLFSLGVLAIAAPAVAQFQRPPPPDPGKPDLVRLVAMEQVKDKCVRETPCKYKVDDRGAFFVVTVEFTRKESPDGPLLPAGRSQITIDRKNNFVKRVDSD
jgi:hypothetical protein